MRFARFAGRRLVQTPLLLAALSLALLMALLGAHFLAIFLLSFLALPLIKWGHTTWNLWQGGERARRHFPRR